jgi:large subunit ribosomal protein L46
MISRFSMRKNLNLSVISRATSKPLCTEAIAEGSNAKRRHLKVKANRPIIQKQRASNALLDNNALEAKLNWRIMGATILHRYPVITKDPEDWEVKFWDLQEKINDKQREWFFEQVGGTDAQLITENNPTYDEILESMPFKPAPRFTEADENNDRKSTERRLQDSLFLIVKRNREDNHWQFPQGRVLDAETLRDTTERVIDRAVGKINRWFVSNAPVGHYQYEYPVDLQQQRQSFGAKVFFYRCQMIKGNVKLQTKLYKDYAWIARDEAGEYFDPETANLLEHVLPS